MLRRGIVIWRSVHSDILHRGTGLGLGIRCASSGFVVQALFLCFGREPGGRCGSRVTCTRLFAWCPVTIR